MRPEIIVTRTRALLQRFLFTSSLEKCAWFAPSFVDDVQFDLVCAWTWTLVSELVSFFGIVESMMLWKCSCLTNITEQTIRIFYFTIQKMRFRLRKNHWLIMFVKFLVILKSSRMPLIHRHIIILTLLYILSPMIYSLRSSQIILIAL